MARKRRPSEARTFARSPQVASASRREPFEVTGSFGAFRRPKVVGVSEYVAQVTAMNRREARKAERAWLRALPKGVKV